MAAIALRTYLMKHPGSCTGMYWRTDPTSKAPTSFNGPPDWPRNGSLLRGEVVEVPSKPQGSLLWLKVAEYQPKGGKWEKTPNCWMQFEQEGLLLHETKL